jgi:hypothetical protein
MEILMPTCSVPVSKSVTTAATTGIIGHNNEKYDISEAEKIEIRTKERN